MIEQSLVEPLQIRSFSDWVSLKKNSWKHIYIYTELVTGSNISQFSADE